MSKTVLAELERLLVAESSGNPGDPTHAKAHLMNQRRLFQAARYHLPALIAATRERDQLRIEVERLRAENAAMRPGWAMNELRSGRFTIQ